MWTVLLADLVDKIAAKTAKMKRARRIFRQKVVILQFSWMKTILAKPQIYPEVLVLQQVFVPVLAV